MSRKRRLLRLGWVFAVLILSLFLVRSYTFHKAPCEQPCRELGQGSDHPTAAPRPACDPLRLSLDIRTHKPKVGHVYGVFFKVKLKNVCCERMNVEGRSFRFFVDNHENRSENRDLMFRVWDPEGRELKPDWDTGFRSEYYPLKPYRADTTLRPGLEPLFTTYNHYVVRLQPGQEITTAPSLLDPFCPESPERQLYIDGFGGEGTAKGRELARLFGEAHEETCARRIAEINPPKPPPPPQGYQALSEYRFEKPGVYKMQAVYHGTFTFEPIYPNAEKLPVLFDVILSNLSFIPSFRLVPWNFETDHIFQVEAVSEVHEFEVLP